MTVNKPISRIFVSKEENLPTIQKLISRGWLTADSNDIFPTQLGEILMLGIVTRLWLTIEFPEYEGTKIDMVHAKAIYKTLNVNGLINTHTINGMECCNLSDEGIQWCISVLVNEDQNGTFDEMMIFAEEEKFRNVTFKELNLDDKFRVKK